MGFLGRFFLDEVECVDGLILECVQVFTKFQAE